MLGLCGLELVTAGSVKPATMLWAEGEPSWVALQDIPCLKHLATGVTPGLISTICFALSFDIVLDPSSLFKDMLLQKCVQRSLNLRLSVNVKVAHCNNQEYMYQQLGAVTMDSLAKCSMTQQHVQTTSDSQNRHF